MKRTVGSLCVFLCALTVLTLAAPLQAEAAEKVNIRLNGVLTAYQEEDGTPLEPVLLKGVTYLPARAIAQSVGVAVEWDDASRTAILGAPCDPPYTPEAKVYVNGAPLPPRDSNGNEVSPVFLKGRTYLPVRAIGEAFGLDVGWDGKTRTVFLNVPAYRLIFQGDWDSLPNASRYMDNVKKEFDAFACVSSRWGREGGEPRTVVVRLTDDSSVSVASTSGGVVTVSRTYAQTHPEDFFYLHEFTHVAQSYSGFTSSWWTENLAEYARFRYKDPSVPKGSSDAPYVASDPAIRDWGWAPYGKCKWFFAWLDSRYPSRRLPDGTAVPGLIDSINTAIKRGEVTSDGGPSMSDPDFNRVVKAVTGVDNMELLRRQYVRELDSGAWTFRGFDDYEDNFLTRDPVRTVKVCRAEDDLLLNARVVSVQGTDKGNPPENLVDGDRATYWLVSGFPKDGSSVSVVLDLGRQTQVGSYALFFRSDIRSSLSVNGQQITPSLYPAAGAWSIRLSEDGVRWRDVYAALRDRNEPVFGEDLGRSPYTCRYVMLEVTAPAGDWIEPMLTELMLFND